MNKKKIFKQLFPKALVLVLLCGIAITTLIVKINKEASVEVSNVEKMYFDAKIIEIRETSVLVEKLSDESKILVYTDQLKEAFIIGDYVNIEYDGEVDETNPPVITATSIEVL